MAQRRDSVNAAPADDGVPSLPAHLRGSQHVANWLNDDDTFQWADPLTTARWRYFGARGACSPSGVMGSSGW